MTSRAALPLAALLLAAACATAAPAGGGAVVEPNETNVVDRLQRGEAEEQVLWITNRSTVPIVVTAVTLRGCDNVSQPCDGPIHMTVPIGPGERKQVLRIRRQHESGTATFDYSFQWKRADGAAPSGE
jgi:hypothetical protein